MKKYAAIVLVVFFLALTSVHFGKEFFHKDQVDSPAKRSTETIETSEISENPSLETWDGNWILFLHYANETRVVDITIGDSMAVSKDTGLIGDLSVSIDEDRSVEMDNDKAHLKGVLNLEGDHLDGMAVMEGIKAPVPFSAFKIQKSAADN